MKSPRAQELNRAVIYYLAKDMQPFIRWKNLGLGNCLLHFQGTSFLPEGTLQSKSFTEIREKHVMPKLSKLPFFCCYN